MYKNDNNLEIKKSLDIFIEILYTQNKSKSTIREYQRVLERFNKFLCNKNISNIVTVNHLEINNFLEDCQRKYNLSYKTKYKYFAFLSNFFRELYNMNLIQQIPTEKLIMKRPTEAKSFFYLDYKEIEKIINVAKNQSSKLRSLTDSCFITLLSESGIRRSDALNLNWNNIKLFKKEIDVHIDKNKKDIKIPISPTLYNELIELKSYLRPNPYDPVFLSNRMNRLPETTINTYFKEYVKRSKIIDSRINEIITSDMPEIQKQKAINEVNVTLHTLKHSFITRCILEGKDVYEIATLTGNNDLDTLLKYKTMLKTDYKEIANIIDLHRKNKTA